MDKNFSRAMFARFGSVAAQSESCLTKGTGKEEGEND